MINLTLEQAKLALEIIRSDIADSEFGQPDYADVEHMQYCLNRAVLAERLKNAINASEGG